MGFVTKFITSTIENIIVNTVEKRLNYNISANSYGPPGVDSRGIKDDRYYIAKKDGKGEFVVIGTLIKSRGAQEGEIIVFSRDSNDNVMAKAYFKLDGQLILQDGTDFAVRYNELKAQLDQLKSDFNTFVGQYNPHTHPLDIPNVVTLTPTPTASPTTVDFSNTKIDNINVPAVGE